jgi:hypothetical protein
VTSLWLFIFEEWVNVPSPKPKVIRKKLGKKFFFLVFWRSLTKRAGSGSGSKSEARDPDPDPCRSGTMLSTQSLEGICCLIRLKLPLSPIPPSYQCQWEMLYFHSPTLSSLCVAGCACYSQLKRELGEESNKTTLDICCRKTILLTKKYKISRVWIKAENRFGLCREGN